MSFSERSPVIIGLIAVAVTVAVTVAALSIHGSDFRGGYEVTAEFADAAGLRVGDDVFIAGARAGTVRNVEIVDNHVEVVLAINGHELPRQSRARIIIRTLTGLRGVDMVPEGDYDQLLAEGDTIAMENTELPTDVPEFGDVSEELLREVDSDALNDLLVSLTDVTRGQREEIATLIEGGTRVTEVVNEQEGNIRSLLQSLREVTAVLNDSGDDMITIIDDFGSTLRTLRAQREELQRFFRQTNATAATTADLVARERAELDRILDEVHGITSVLSRHQMDLAEALAYAGDSIVGFSSITYAGEVEVPWGHVFVQSAGPLGIDLVSGCGGLIDQQLDEVLGPDPRSCEEQANDTFPENPDEQAPNPDGPPDRAESDSGESEDEGPLPVPPSAQSSGLDTLARRALPEGAR